VTQERRLLRVGLTGGTGAGKTLVARLFRDWGALLIEADLIGREVVERGSSAWQALVDRFGEAILLPDGSIDRAMLGRAVFTDQESRRALDSIVHPHLLERLRQRIEESEERAGAERRILVVDAALLFEWEVLDWFDRIVVVVASEERCMERLVGDGLAVEVALGRIRAQLDPEAKAARADEVIRNDGTLEELEAAAREVWKRLLHTAHV
jgi:dephospho-CoA kinase